MDVERAAIEVLDEGYAHSATVQPHEDLPLSYLWKKTRAVKIAYGWVGAEGANMRGPLGVAATLVATLLLFSCASWRTDLAPFAGRPCTEVVEGLEEARQVVAATFGGGVDGREAQETIADTIEARPDCFSEEEVEFARGIRQQLPASDAEADALREAEEACENLVGEEVVTGHAGLGHDSPEQTLAETDEMFPSGEPERSFEEDGRVGFDYRDGATYQGWVMVQQSDDGWFVKRVITCGAVGPQTAG